MSKEHADFSLDELDQLAGQAAVNVNDLVRWEGMLAVVADVAHLGPYHDQVVLQRLDRRALPISLAMSDLNGAEVWHFAGKLR